MNLMIGVPAYGGMVTARFANSLHETTTALNRAGIGYVVQFLTGESLIQRARNSLATDMMREPKFDRLFFIDADLEWEANDFLTVATSRRGLIGGTYPAKGFPIRMNFNYLDGEREFKGKSPEDLIAYAAARGENGEVRVKHIPTGFMCIHRSVFERLAPYVETYHRKMPVSGERLTERNYFPVEVVDGQLMSEDWMFCELCRKHDIPIFLQSNVMLPHTGAFTYSPHAKQPNIR